MGIIDDVRTGLARATTQVAGALQPAGDVPFEMMQKALEDTGLAEPTEEIPRGLFHDPYAVQDWGGWRERPSVLTYETLRQMSTRNTVIAAIIQTRVNQVAQFCRPQQGRYDKGYRVILRDRRDSKRQMSPMEARQAAEIERMVETTGFLLPDEKPADRDSFRAFIKKSVRDILVYDQWCWEKIRDRRDRLSRFVCLPSHTIRPAVSDVEHMLPQDRRDRVQYVQVYEDSVVAEFSADDLAWCVMNPRSDLRVNGFGFSPIEQLTNVITSWLYGFEYNTRFFTQGSAIKGILNIKGAIPDRQLKAFRRMWYSQLTGTQNAWRTPILNSDDIQWMNMHSTNRDMEFSSWMDFLIKITSAVFSIDSMEVGFSYGTSGGQSKLFDKTPNEAQVTESKDKGLRPLVEHIQDALNSHIIWEINPDFEFEFSGLDAKAEENERAAAVQEVKHFRTVDEVRALQDLDPLPDGKGEVILDSVWLQNAQSGEGGGGLEEHDEDAGDDDGDEEEVDFGLPGDDPKEGDDAGALDDENDEETEDRMQDEVDGENEPDADEDDQGDEDEDTGDEDEDNERRMRRLAASMDSAFTDLRKAHYSRRGDRQTIRIQLRD